jgi:hypothetical protein
MNTKRQVDWNRVKSLYETLTDELSLAQYSKLMGGSMEYLDKARRAKEVSKSKNVHYLANAIEYLITGTSNGLDALQKDNLNRKGL